MQGDILFAVYLFNCEDNSSQILCHFHLSCRFFFWSFYYIISVWFLPLYLLSQGWQCTQCPQPLALTCFLPSEVLWFWSRCCWSALHVPLGLGLCLGRSLSVWEGYIHWLAPAGATPLVTWSGAVTRRRPAGASVPAVWPAEWSPGSSSVQSVGETSHAGRGVNWHMTRCPHENTEWCGWEADCWCTDICQVAMNCKAFRRVDEMYVCFFICFPFFPLRLSICQLYSYLLVLFCVNGVKLLTTLANLFWSFRPYHTVFIIRCRLLSSRVDGCADMPAQ